MLLSGPGPVLVRGEYGAGIHGLAVTREVLDAWLIDDIHVRRGLLTRIARRLAESYADQIQGATIDEKMTSLAEIFEQRQIPFDVDRSNELPVLTALACPYPTIAEHDRSVCAMERMMFEEMLGEKVKLGQCRLDGSSCCTFELSTASH